MYSYWLSDCNDECILACISRNYISWRDIGLCWYLIIIKGHSMLPVLLSPCYNILLSAATSVVNVLTSHACFMLTNLAIIIYFSGSLRSELRQVLFSCRGISLQTEGHLCSVLVSITYELESYIYFCCTHNIMNSSWATSHVRWFNGENTNVPRTIFFVILRVLKYT